MIDELRTASSLLDAALRRYRDACSAIAGSRSLGNFQEDILQGISDTLLEELDRAHSHKNQLQQSILTISHARNTIPLISPIAILPPDIMSQIFGAIIGMQPDYLDNLDYLNYLGDEELYQTPRLNYPETLAHVCSRWRRLALDMRWLWIRINLPFDRRETSPGWLERARAFAARADPLLLDLNIHGSTDIRIVVGTTLNPFCATIASRTRSLNMSLTEYFDNQLIPVLETIFKNCLPGVLDRLTIGNDVELDNFEATLIESFEAPEHEDEDDRQTLRIKLTQQQLDRCLLPIRILELAGAYFDWNSQVYHNLTEFHLFNSSDIAFITESQLGKVLGASPGLRVLSLFIRPITPQSCATVRLNELEVLNFGPMTTSAFRVLFRLISPGPKLSRVALNMRLCAFGYFKVSFEAFLSHSKANQPCFDYRNRNPYIQLEALEFFKSSPDLEVSAFSNLRLARQGNGSPLPQESKSSIQRPRLKTLYLGYCEIDLDYLQRMTSILSIQTLVFLGCSVRLDPTTHGYTEAEAVHQELAKFIPTLKYIPVDEKAKE